MKTYKRGSSLRPKGKRGFTAFVDKDAESYWMGSAPTLTETAKKNKVTVFDTVCLTIAGISSIVSLATVVFLW